MHYKLKSMHAKRVAKDGDNNGSHLLETSKGFFPNPLVPEALL
jgi:hypothetical protein